ncbi:MAG: leucine-rich repeat protein [Kiritimatiellae bacterium]|nr:leucine-rich repeat protein [Kiritimatiellia bacterium]
MARTLTRRDFCKAVAAAVFVVATASVQAAADFISPPFAIGQVVASDGKTYDSVSDAVAAGTTALAMIAYLDLMHETGLAIALTDVGEYQQWEDCEQAATRWMKNKRRQVSFGEWRIPSFWDWDLMRYGNTAWPSFEFEYRLNDCGGDPLELEKDYWPFGYAPETRCLRLCLELRIQSDAAGSSGDCRWMFDADAMTLIIYGTGRMADYSGSNASPWTNNDFLTNVTVQSGVTHISANAFPGTATASAYLPESLVSIGKDAFAGCEYLRDVYCRADPAALDWQGGDRDFLADGTTRIHVRSDRLAAYREKFGATVRGVFVGDLPFDSYAEWAAAYGCDATDGNVFRYAFDTPDAAPTVGIAFDGDSRVVVKTPRLINTAGFSYSVVASDDIAGAVNAAAYPLSADGATEIREPPAAARFFRLEAAALP